MKHKTWIKNYERDSERLAEEIGDLRYDSLAEFLDLLAKKLNRDGNGDRDRGRRHLSEKLYEAKDQLNHAADAVNQAWRICEPYMLPPDIMAKIKLEFTDGQEQRTALALLLNFNRRDYANDTFRLERCLLFQLEGDLNRLRRNISIAQDDYRDIIMMAEYEGDERVRDLNFPFGTAEQFDEGDEYPGPPDDLPF
ncbi:MAG: hypothetical protein AB8H12_03460 [Lewinella sp.]